MDLGRDMGICHRIERQDEILRWAQKGSDWAGWGSNFGASRSETALSTFVSPRVDSAEGPARADVTPTFRPVSQALARNGNPTICAGQALKAGVPIDAVIAQNVRETKGVSRRLREHFRIYGNETKGVNSFLMGRGKGRNVGPEMKVLPRMCLKTNKIQNWPGQIHRHARTLMINKALIARGENVIEKKGEKCWARGSAKSLHGLIAPYKTSPAISQWIDEPTVRGSEHNGSSE